MKILIVVIYSVLALGLRAEPLRPSDKVAAFDQVEISEGKIAFGGEWNALRPYLSGFEVEYCRFLSNKLGERFALVTFTSRKAGLKSVREEHIVGVFANGERRRAIRLEGEAQVGARGSLLVHFGTHAFPLVGLETRTE